MKHGPLQIDLLRFNRLRILRSRAFTVSFASILSNFSSGAIYSNFSRYPIPNQSNYSSVILVYENKNISPFKFSKHTMLFVCFLSFFENRKSILKKLSTERNVCHAGICVQDLSRMSGGKQMFMFWYIIFFLLAFSNSISKNQFDINLHLTVCKHKH